MREHASLIAVSSIHLCVCLQAVYIKKMVSIFKGLDICLSSWRNNVPQQYFFDLEVNTVLFVGMIICTANATMFHSLVGRLICAVIVN